MSTNEQLSHIIAHISASGWLCCAPFLISTAALALSFVASATCNLVILENSDYFPLPARSVGLWCYTTFGGSAYSTVNAPFDAKFDAARGCGAATLILGIIAWLYYCFAGCCHFTPVLFRIVGFLCVCNTMFQSLVFLVLQSDMCDDGCGLDTASYCAIVASILWFLTGGMSCVAGKPVEEEIPPEDGEYSDAEGSQDSVEKEGEEGESYSSEEGSGELSEIDEEEHTQEEDEEEQPPVDSETADGEEKVEEGKR